MTIELYEVPASDASEPLDSPISSTTGELPDQEPTLDLGNLLGSFDSREEAIDFVTKQFSADNQSVANNRVEPFNAYTHVELLTVSIQQNDQSTQNKRYYLVTDEGY